MKIKELLIIAAVVFLVLGSILIGCEEPKAAPPDDPAVDDKLGLLVTDSAGSAFDVGTIAFQVRIYDTDNISAGNLFTGNSTIVAYGTSKKLTQDRTNVILYKGSSGRTQWSKTNGHGTFSVVMTGEEDELVLIGAETGVVFDKGVGTISIDDIFNQAQLPLYSNTVGLKLIDYYGSDPILVTDVISGDWMAGSIDALITSGNTNGAYIYSASEKNLKNASWDKNDHILLLSGTGGTYADVFYGDGGPYTVFAVKGGTAGSGSEYITDVTFTAGSASADWGTAGTVAADVP
ncbi:hypothetical protein AGMMS50212_04050 [Spirochaetia bacterium]|nr:hypothetical protein AGMMS50212_04050 [Spirochaetia bacterium]